MTSLVPLFIKRAFKDNPLFSDSKVIYSLYNDDFKGGFREGYDKKLKMPGIVAKEIKWLKNPMYANIQKSALDFADGIVMASPEINKDVEKYARSLGKPILEYPGEENYVDAYNDFYDKIITL